MCKLGKIFGEQGFSTTCSKQCIYTNKKHYKAGELKDELAFQLPYSFSGPFCKS